MLDKARLWRPGRIPGARFLRLRFRESDGLHRSPETGPDGVYRGDVSNDERGMELPARAKSRSQICCLGGRSFSSDITMPLRLTTACADSPAQLPPRGVAVRAHQVSSLLGGRSFSSDITVPLTEEHILRGLLLARPPASRKPHGRAGVHPRRKRIVLRPTTACAESPAQSPPYDVDPKRELAPKLPNSNRSRYRLEFNISPTKQRTEVLSNRSYKWRFGEPNQPARQHFGGLLEVINASRQGTASVVPKSAVYSGVLTPEVGRTTAPPICETGYNHCISLAASSVEANLRYRD